MDTRKIVLYWLALLIPTLIISVSVFRMLRHEQDRIESQRESAIQERAELIAGNIQDTVATVHDSLGQVLAGMPGDSTVDRLLDLQRGNPLVRNVFLWNPEDGLVYPHNSPLSTADERLFITRHGALFSSSVPWESALPEVSPAAPSPPRAPSAWKRGSRSGYVRARQQQIADMASLKPASRPPVTTGWTPWFSDNRLSYIGWTKTSSDTVYGIEMELMILRSQLISLLPADEQADTVYALIDGNGRIMQQTSNTSLADVEPLLSVSLAPEMPHWQIAAYMPDGMSAAGGKSFVILSSVLLFIFIAAIIFGGSMLLLQAHSSARDARQKTSFVSNVSHELKTPLTSIRMYAELLSEGRVRDAAKKQHYLSVIASEAQRLTRLVNNVLDFSRLEQSRKKYRMEEINVSDLLYAFVKSNQLRTDEAGLKVNLHISDPGISLMADRDALEQVLLNLIDNAVKYAAAGGEVGISLEADGSLCRVAVTDRGPGIPAAHRTRIFDKFHRVDETLTAEQAGSGLGLSIARNLLRGMGGDLSYRPGTGGGSTFEIALPVVTHSDENAAGDIA